jgi:glycosyltransferase involved in cell wall biosynthesis
VRAGLNAQLLYLSDSYRAAGINRYIHQLLVHLRPLAKAGEEIVAFTGRWKLPPELTATYHFKVKQSRFPTWRPPVRILWEQFLQPPVILRERLDLLHSLSYVQPLLCPTKSVVTMLDLSFLRMPETFNRWNRVYLATMARLSAQRCQKIITISESTRQDVVRFFGVSPDKVQAIHLGVDEIYKPVEDKSILQRFKAERNLPDSYLLYLGTLEPRKNVERLIEAYAILKKKQAIPHKLVLGGAKGWLYDRIFARVNQLGLHDDILFTSYIPYNELPLWYNCADIFIYPSLYEGFGLPPLEALACGTPVITSSTSSLPEVVGTAAITIDPLDVNALASAISTVLENPDIQRQLSTQGLQQAARFSWGKMAARTLEVYRQVIES